MIISKTCIKIVLQNSMSIYDKNSPASGHRGKLYQHNGGHIWPIHSQWWKTKTFPLRSERRQGCPLSTFFQHSFIGPTIEIGVNRKVTTIRPSVGFSTETLHTRREWQDIFKILKGKNVQPRILYAASLSFTTEGERISLTSKKLKTTEILKIS